MAESAVSFLLRKLGSLLDEEVKLLRGARGEIGLIKDELESMRAFLRGADAREHRDECIKAWVNQVRNAAYDAEDILDVFMITFGKQAQQHGFFQFIHKGLRFLKLMKSRHIVANDMQVIRANFREIEERRLRYQINYQQPGPEPELYDLRLDSVLLQESELVGINKHKHRLIQSLLNGPPTLTVLSVVGIGGLGKTTLVKQIYDSLKSSYKHHAWITISHSKGTEEILRDMILQLWGGIKKSLPQGFHGMKDFQLKPIIQDFLHEKRFVIVFDNLWGIQTWDSIRHVLSPHDECASRVIITSRTNTIATYCTHNHEYEYYLPPLSEEDAWNLFCRIAFSSSYCPVELHELAHDFLRTCKGLPLAVVSLGNLLSTRGQTRAEWEIVRRSLRYELDCSKEFYSLKRFMYLSYLDLPYYLKSCFLYLSLFPMGDPIEPMRLVRLWIAEGFVEEVTGMTMEEIAASYLCELISRNLVEVAEFTTHGGVKRCRIHDLLHEFIISKSKEEGTIVYQQEQDARLHEKKRRISIQGNIQIELENINSHLRSLLIFGSNALSVSAAFFNRIPLLKVLDLRGASIETFPNGIVNLFNLRYLSLRDTKIKVLPNSIGKLENLETLDLKQTDVSELPVGIRKLTKLRHLLVYQYAIESHVPFNSKRGFKALKEIACFSKSLQKMSFVEADQGEGMMEVLCKLRHLRRLGIIKLKKEDGNGLCLALECMRHLRSLSVTSIDEEEILDLQNPTSPFHDLQRLYMNGRLKTLPNWISSLDNLVRLSLRWSKLSADPLEALQALPKLMELQLDQAYNGKALLFKKNCFGRLKILALDNLHGLKSVEIEEGAMPNLEQLDINRCELLEKVPLGLKGLVFLKVFWLYEMPNSFRNRLIPNQGGEDHDKIKHIQDVHLGYWENGGWECYNLHTEQTYLPRLDKETTSTSSAFIGQRRRYKFC